MVSAARKPGGAQEPPDSDSDAAVRGSDSVPGQDSVRGDGKGRGPLREVERGSDPLTCG